MKREREPNEAGIFSEASLIYPRIGFSSRRPYATWGRRLAGEVQRLLKKCLENDLKRRLRDNSALFRNLQKLPGCPGLRSEDQPLWR